ALIGMARIDPYMTALNLMQRHAADKDFADVESLIVYAKSRLPPTPVNRDRSLFENLQGILALFRGNSSDAHKWFQLAINSAPDSAVAELNLSFADIQTGKFEAAAARMADLAQRLPGDSKLLASTGYVTWAAAQLGRHDIEGADRLLTQAIEL